MKNDHRLCSKGLLSRDLAMGDLESPGMSGISVKGMSVGTD